MRRTSASTSCSRKDGQTGQLGRGQESVRGGEIIRTGQDAAVLGSISRPLKIRHKRLPRPPKTAGYALILKKPRLLTQSGTTVGKPVAQKEQRFQLRHGRQPN